MGPARFHCATLITADILVCLKFILYQIALKTGAFISGRKRTSEGNRRFPIDWLKNSDYEPIVGVLRHMENSAPSLKIFFPDAL